MTRSRRSSAISRRCSRVTATRSSSTSRCSAGSSRSGSGARRSGSTPSSCACSSATTRSSSAPARSSTRAGKKRLAAINERLATLGTLFGQNVLADEKAYMLVLDGEDDLAGLPEFAPRGGGADGGRSRRSRQARHHPVALEHRAVPAILDSGATSARRPSRPGRGAARTAARPTTGRSWPRRWRSAPSARGSSAMRATPTSASPTRWRRRRRRRAISSSGVWAAGASARRREAGDLQALIAEEGGNFALAPSDWRYYAERMRKRRFDFDEAS